MQFNLARNTRRCATLLLLMLAARTGDGQTQVWEHAPYRIRLTLAVAAPGGLRQQLEASLPAYLVERADASVGPIWALEIDVATGNTRSQLMDELAVADAATDAAADYDKRMLVSIVADGAGFRIQAREYDSYVERWGVTRTDHCDQRAMLAERLFRLVWKTFSPLARLELNPEDEGHVLLELRGADIARKDPLAKWIAPGDVLLPILRRTTRDGELIDDGIQAVPWTYVSAEKIDEGTVVARVESGTRRPFGVRRRGRVEQLAIAVRADAAPLTIHVHSRDEPDKPLVGYEVFAEDTDDDSLSLVGVTDRTGRLAIAPGSTRIKRLIVKNGGQLLARLPVVPGATPELDVPLPDDDSRLQAESALSALRENLVDVVAQRTILIARARRQIDADELERAEELLDQLDELPGRSQFSRELNQLQRQHTTNDPQAQRRIERMFTDTESILGHFLDARAINKLRDEFNAAKNAGG